MSRCQDNQTERVSHLFRHVLDYALPHISWSWHGNKISNMEVASALLPLVMRQAMVWLDSPIGYSEWGFGSEILIMEDPASFSGLFLWISPNACVTPTLLFCLDVAIYAAGLCNDWEKPVELDFLDNPVTLIQRYVKLQ